MGLWRTEGLEVTDEERLRNIRLAEKAERTHLQARRHLDVAARRAEDAARAAKEAAAECREAGGGATEGGANLSGSLPLCLGCSGDFGTTCPGAGQVGRGRISRRVCS